MSLTSDNQIIVFSHIHLSNLLYTLGEFRYVVSYQTMVDTQKKKQKQKQKKQTLQHWLTKFVERASLTMDSGLAHLQKDIL